MHSYEENGKTVLVLEGRIDSANAADFEREALAFAAEHPGLSLDAERLEYISSAGLRVLMKLRKQEGRPLDVANVSPEVYEIFETTGFTELLNVKKRLREVSIEGCEAIGEGGNGKVYRLTADEMIKVYRPGHTLAQIEQEREASRRTFLLGVPCAIAFDTVKVGDRYGTVYETLKAATLSERVRENPARLEELAEAAAKLLRELHAIEIPEGQLPPADQWYHRTLDRLTEDFTPEEIEKLHALYRTIPAGNRFIHNDFHSKNIMETGNGELMLIDMDSVSAGNPLYDLIHCHMIYRVMGTGTGEKSDDDLSFIGLTYGEMKRFWQVFGETYFGSAEAAADMDERLHPFALMMYYTESMGSPILPAQYHPVYVQYTREQVLSRYDELLGTFAGFPER